MSIIEGSDIEWPVNWEFSYTDRFGSNPSVNLMLPSLLTCDQTSMASDLEVLIPAAPHLAANCSSASWMPLPAEGSRTTSSEEGRNEILWTLNRKLSTTWLHLQILSIKIWIESEIKGSPGGVQDAGNNKLVTASHTPHTPKHPHGIFQGSDAFCRSTKHVQAWVVKLLCTLKYPWG